MMPRATGAKDVVPLRPAFKNWQKIWQNPAYTLPILAKEFEGMHDHGGPKIDRVKSLKYNILQTHSDLDEQHQGELKSMLDCMSERQILKVFFKAKLKRDFDLSMNNLHVVLGRPSTLKERDATWLLFKRNQFMALRKPLLEKVIPIIKYHPGSEYRRQPEEVQPKEEEVQPKEEDVQPKEEEVQPMHEQVLAQDQDISESSDDQAIDNFTFGDVESHFEELIRRPYLNEHQETPMKQGSVCDKSLDTPVKKTSKNPLTTGKKV